jgi:hypothetical protein
MKKLNPELLAKNSEGLVDFLPFVEILVSSSKVQMSLFFPLILEFFSCQTPFIGKVQALIIVYNIIYIKDGIIATS